MKQIFQLVKKDLSLAKNYMAAIILFSIVLPIAMSRGGAGPEGFSSILYGSLVMMLSFMAYHMISMEEMKEEGMVYIQTTPISNTLISLAKFTVVFIGFILVSLIYFILSRIELTQVGAIGFRNIIFTFLLVELFFSIYIPLTFKLGYAKLQLVSAGIIFATPFALGLISKEVDSILRVFIKIANIPNGLLIGISIVFAIFILFTSINISSKILASKEY